jgi:hypothetical protein
MKDEKKKNIASEEINPDEIAELNEILEHINEVDENEQVKPEKKSEVTSDEVYQKPQGLTEDLQSVDELLAKITETDTSEAIKNEKPGFWRRIWIRLFGRN